MKHFIYCILCLLIGIYTWSPASLGAEKDLTTKLKELSDSSIAKLPAEKRKIMEDAIDGLRKSHIVDHALKRGDRIPNFSLLDATKKEISSEVLLKKGPIVLVFYRGGWCPYCNLQLHDLQAHLPEIKNLGADLVAISPQNPDNSISTAEKEKLAFHVLSDQGNIVGRKFGLVYKLPDSLKKLYQQFGIDLERSNSLKEWELPLSATYIVDTNGKIYYSFLDVDYRKRAETKDVIEALQKLKNER